MPRFLYLFSLLLVVPFAHAENWPAWRGPSANGISKESGLPVTWTATKNIKWKFALPEPGNSTPIIWENHVFLTQSLAGGQRRALLALNRVDGKFLWQQEVPCDVKETTHKQNPPCSASAITDGTTVFADFASAGVAAFDFQGKKLWHRDLGPVLHRWGNGSSPILYKNLLIVFHGPGEPAFLMALDKKTGATVWKTSETAINSNIFGTWSTPVIVRVGQRDELVFALPGDKIGGDGEFKGYDPDTGKELWRCKGLGNEVYAMPVVSPAGDVIVGISGHNGPLLAIRPGGRGDTTATNQLWRAAGKNPQRIGTGIIHEGRLYIADAPGMIECLDLKTGDSIWKERLPGNLWGSIMLADGKLYVSSFEGDTFVVAAGPKFQLLARNEIPEQTYAALAVSQGNLFLRTHQHLYCIEDKK